MNADLADAGVAALEHVSSVDFHFELVCLDSRPFQPQCFSAIGALGARALRLQRAAERIGVVLQRDDALDRTGLGVDYDDAALEQARRVGECRHTLFLLVVLLAHSLLGSYEDLT